MSTQHFNTLARALHWLMAVLVLVMLFVGVTMVSTVSQREWLFDLHRPLGATILVLALIRLVNRLRHPPPPLPADLPRWQARAAIASHWLLYALLIALPLLGWATLSAGGYPVTLFGKLQLPPIVPQSALLYGWLHAAHVLLAWLLFSAILLHLAAALFHAWIRRDGVFSAMARGAPKYTPVTAPAAAAPLAVTVPNPAEVAQKDATGEIGSKSS